MSAEIKYERRTNKERKIESINIARANRVKKENFHSIPSRTPSQRVGKDVKDFISFERINVHGINQHVNFVELISTMGMLEQIKSGVYRVVKT